MYLYSYILRISCFFASAFVPRSCGTMLLVHGSVPSATVGLKAPTLNNFAWMESKGYQFIEARQHIGLI